MFLHVLELADENVAQPTSVTTIPGGIAIGDRWKVKFALEGPAGGSINGAPLATTLKVEGQYR